jgi:hypothetical protein
MASMPSMPDDEGRVALLNPSLAVIEEVAYTDDWHHAILSNTEGVSLERINPQLVSTEGASWHSAASQIGFATPGRLNSQFNTSGSHQGEFTLSTETLSPNNDGFNDVVLISYRLPQGSMLTLSVFSLNGILQRTLTTNELAEPEGSTIWDGKDDHFQLVSTGIYIIFAEWFTPDGSTGAEKLTLTVSR